MENAASWPVCQNTTTKSIPLYLLITKNTKAYSVLKLVRGSVSLQTKFQIPSKVQGRREPLKQNRQ